MSSEEHMAKMRERAAAANRLNKQRRLAEDLRQHGWLCVEPGDPAYADCLAALKWVSK